MTITLNGQPHDLPPATHTLLALVTDLGLKPDQVALEQNGVIIRRAHWPETPLHPGDRLEIVQFVGGGTPTPPRSAT